MSNFLEIKIYDKIYIQRSEFGKIQEFTLDGVKTNTYEELPAEIKKIINLSLEMEQNPDDFFEYCEVEGGLRLTYIKDNPEIKNFIKIPESINGMPIVELGSGTLLADKNLYGRIEQIQLPDTIRKINKKCFAMMYNLKLVNTPKNLKILEARVFQDCSSLIEFDTSNVEEIGTSCFAQCKNIKEMNLEKAKISSDIFVNCEKLETIKLSDKLTFIPSGFANNCRTLTNINLPDTITHIYDFAFLNCRKLNLEKLPKNLIEICNKAFAKTAFKKLILLDKVKVGEDAFMCSDLEHIELGKDVTVVNKINGYNNPFSGCMLKEIKIHNNPIIENILCKKTIINEER